MGGTARASGANIHFDPDRALRWMPLRETWSSAIVVDIDINGTPLRAMLDTGWGGEPAVEVSAEAARRLGLHADGDTTDSGYGGRSHRETAAIASFAVGGFSTGDWRVSIDPAIRPSDGWDAIVGFDVLRLAALQVDWADRRARLLFGGELDRAGIRPASATVSVNARDHPTVTAAICGRQIELIVDTGDNSDLVLSETAVQGASDCRSPGTSDRRAIGVGGPLIKKLVGVREIELGDTDIPAVLADLFSPEQMAGLKMQGSVGTGVLRRFEFILDVAAGRLAFYAPVRRPRPNDRPTSGIQFQELPDRLEVTHVMANSPAELAGLRAGASICGLNGRTIKALAGRIGAIKPDPQVPVGIETCDGKTLTFLAADFLRPPTAQGTQPTLTAFPADVGWLTRAMAACERATEPESVAACDTMIAARHTAMPLGPAALAFRERAKAAMQGRESKPSSPAVR